MENSYAIEISNLTVAYDTNPVLFDIDLKIPTGKLIAIIGPNGAGKSTLIKTILNFIKPVFGNINFPEFNGEKFYKKTAYVPQCTSVDWDFPATVLNIVIMGRYGKIGLFKRPKKPEKEMAFQCLEKLGMKEYSERQISNLSGGQQQRVFLARALVQDAEIYLLDEPFKGIDIQTEKLIVEILKELTELGKTVIVVHHDLQTVKEYFNWVVLINKSIIATGKTEDIFNSENLRLTYDTKNSLNKRVI